MNFDPKYTIPFDDCFHVGGLIRGNTFIYWSNGVMCELVGPYCMWPKQEPRMFVVTNTLETFIDRKIIFKKPDDKIKFHQTLNRRKW